MRILYIILLLLIYSCHKSTCEQEFNFEFPISITPQDTFQIGDTIWFEMNLPDNMMNKNTGGYVNWSNFELYFQQDLTRWDTSLLMQCTYQFDIVESIGIVEQKNNTFQFNYISCKSVKEKHFRFGLIPTITGKFLSTIAYPLYYYEQEELGVRDPDRMYITDSECRQYFTKNSTISINNGMINHQLLDGICLPTEFSTDTFCMFPYNHAVDIGMFAFVVR